VTSLSIVAQFIENYNEKQWRNLFNVLDKHVILEQNEIAVIQGIQAFDSFICKMTHAFDERLFDIHYYYSTTCASKLSTQYQVEGYYKNGNFKRPANNQHYSITRYSFFEISNGKITKISTFFNRKKMIDQIT